MQTVNSPQHFVVEDYFLHNTLPCVIVANRTFDYRCGYVGIPKSYSLHGLHYSDICFDYIVVHGGLTYSGYMSFNRDLPILNPAEPYWFFGFDCNHSFDAYDPKLATNYDGRYYNPNPFGTIRTHSFVKSELKDLCDQLTKLILATLGWAEIRELGNF